MARETRRASERRAVRDVPPSALRDLLDHPPRATVAFVDHEEVDLVPVRARTSADTPQYQFGVRPEIGSDFESREVVLVIDDGPYWFELRGVSVRGVARRIARNEGGHDDSLAWYGIEPGRIVAWDYGAIREE